MKELLVVLHVGCGAIVLLLGIFNMVNRKGAKNHILIGRIYVGAMWMICLSAFLMISFFRFSFFLMVIGVLTFYASFVGVRVIRRAKSGREAWYDWAVAIITTLFGAGLLVYGGSIFYQAQGFHILGLLSLIFGVFTAKSGIDDLIFFTSNKTREKNWWLYQHISAICGSYIAAVTAFAVQNGNVFLADSSYNWTMWILPAIIGSPIISYVIRQRRKKAMSAA